MSVVDEYVFHYLQALNSCGFSLVFLTTSSLKSVELERLRTLTHLVVQRSNTGYDFAAWTLALDLFPEALQASTLLLANDSVYGPLCDLKSLFEEMSKRKVDFWGITASNELQYHLQSYFLCFRSRALRHPAFRSFFVSDEAPPSKHRVIQGYETRLTRCLAEAGLTHDTYLRPLVTLANPTLTGSLHVLQSGCPFLKVSLLRDNTCAADLARVYSHITAISPEMASHVQNHIKRLKETGNGAL
jgi:lipopolysaccharide biosynthesis protein